jgi:hypothetical protein
MTCIEKLRELHPEWDEDRIGEVCAYDCVEEHGIEVGARMCGYTTCAACWEREYVEPIPHEFEYLSKCMIYDKDSGRKMRKERVWVTKVGQMRKHHYTGNPYFRIRTESESGGVWEGWVTEEDIREMLEGRVT